MDGKIEIQYLYHYNIETVLYIESLYIAILSAEDPWTVALCKRTKCKVNMVKNQIDLSLSHYTY